MSDYRGVWESRLSSKRAKKSLAAGFVPQSGITERRSRGYRQIVGRRERAIMDGNFGDYKLSGN